MHQYWATRVHISRHIAALSVGVLIGSGVAPWTPFEILASGWWLVATLGMVVSVIHRQTRVFLLVSLCAGMSLGLWRGTIELQAQSPYKLFVGHVVQLKGSVSEDASFDARGNQRFELSNIVIRDRHISGRVWVSLRQAADIKRGDSVSIKGRLKEGFGPSAASMHFAEVERIERPNPGDVARRVRDHFADGVRDLVPEPQASLGVGFLTGQRSTLPPDLNEQMRATGLTHIVVASGYNLTVLVLFTRQAFAGISKYLATLAAGSLILGFLLVTGYSSSMARAGLVAGLGLAAWYYGRSIKPFILLPFAAAVTVLVRPAFLWGDIGWYLSFAAFAGVLVLAPLIRQYIWKEKEPGILLQLLTDTFAAQITTLPIILFVFGEYATYALLANALVLPFVPLSMLLTFVSGLASLLLPMSAAQFLSIPTTWILQHLTQVIKGVAVLPGAQGTVAFGLPALVVSYVMVILICVYIWSRIVRRTKPG